MKNREWLRRLPMDLLMDIVGGLIYAVGLNCFANPNDIAPGGMSGVAVILNYLFEIPMGITIFCVNIPLLLLAWRFLGHEFTLHSLKTILVWSVLVDVVALTCRPMPEIRSWQRCLAVCASALRWRWCSCGVPPPAGPIS